MELTPPDILQAPEPVRVVEPEQAQGMIKLKPEAMQALDQKSAQFIDDILALDVHSDSFKDRLNAVHAMGNAEMVQAAKVSSRFLERPANTGDQFLKDERSPVSKALIDLRNTVEKLDPSAQGDLFQPRKLLGMIPMGNKLRDYFMRFQSSQSHIAGILNTLYRSQDELKRDNAAIEQEKVALWTAMQAIQGYVHMGKQIDAALEARLAVIQSHDPEKAKVVQEEMLFYVRQKVRDLLTQMAVCIQGYMALDLVRKNNLELIKGVDRASTTTVTALRTAVIVAQAMANQKLVLDQINALNTTTGNLIESTSRLLKQQTEQVTEQSINATVNIEQLQAAFQNIYATMDLVSEYKQKALGSMQATVQTLTAEVAKAQSYIEKNKTDSIAQERLQLGSGYTL